MHKLLSIIGVIILAFFSLNVSAASSFDTRLIIAIDVSHSMQGDTAEMMKKVLNELVVMADESTSLEIYTFGRQLTPLTVSGESDKVVIEKINDLGNAGYTALYDSINTAVQIASKPNDKILFLTDGKDSASKLTLNQLLSRLTGNTAPLSFISNQADAQEISNLTQIAVRARGAVFRADQPDLFLAFLANPVSGTAHSAKSQENQSVAQIYLISGATGVTALLLLSGMQRNRSRSRNRSSLNKAIEPYDSLINRPIEEHGVRSRSSLTSGWSRRIFGDLTQIFPNEQNGLKIATIGGVAISLAILFWFIGAAWITNIIFTTSITIWLVRKMISQKVNKKIREFEKELPNALKLLAASLSSGLSFLQAVESLSADTQSEVNRQFRRALSEIQMGNPVEKALLGVARRMKSKDLEWTVFAFNIQREVGGSLSKILQTTAESIEARANIRREIRTLSAEGRLSIYILMMLPIAVLLFFLFVKPDFLQVFWSEPIGNYLLLTVFAFITMAWFWMKRIIRIEV